MKIEKCYIMNLPQRTDRRAACIEEMEKAGIENYEFIDSVHWKDIPLEEREWHVTREYKHRTKDKEAQWGNVGCGMSHLKTYDAILNEYGDDGSKAFLLLEDDIFFTNPNNAVPLMEKITDMTPDWAMIYMGGLRNTNGDKREEYLPGLEKAISVWNSHAYLVKNSHDFIGRMIEVAKRGYWADRGLRKVIRDDKKNSHRYLITWPYEILQKRGYSDINKIVR